jgi:heat shock protein HslJ
LGAPTAVLADKAAQSVSLPTTARGNEPFWSVTLDNGLLVFQQMDGPRIDVTLPKVDKLEGGAMKFSTDLAVTLTPAVCRDTMSGMPHPLTATVETGGQTLEGCAGAPVDLLAGEWVVTSVGDAKVADAISVTIAFDPTHDRVSGGSGCNRYFGGFSLTGEGMTFGQGMGGTMMMCDDAQMKIERSFLDAMPKVTGFDIDADGNLLLKAGDDTAITAKR